MTDYNKLFPNFPQTTGLDNNNLDINQGLEKNQSNLNTPSPDSAFWATNPGASVPNLVGPSTLESPTHYDDNGDGKSLQDWEKGLSDPMATDNGEDKYVQGSVLPNEAFTAHYPEYVQGLNNEAIAANKQSTMARIGNGLTKAVGTGLVTLAQGLLAPTYGMAKGFQEGRFDAIYDNDLMKGLDEANKKMQTAFPNYRTEVQQNNGVGNISWWLPGGEGLWSSNFIFDKTAGMVGFMGGMALSAYALGGIGGVIGDSMPVFGKVAASGQLVETLDAANEIMTAGVPNAQKWATWSQKMSDLAQNSPTVYNVLNKGQRLVANTFASAGISSSMALETMNTVKSNLTKKFIQENGYEPGDYDRQKIEDLATSAGKTMFGLSTLLSSYSFHGSLGKIMGGFEKNEMKNLADQVVLKQGDKELSSGIQSAGKEGVEATMYGAKAPEQLWYDQTAFGKSAPGRAIKSVGGFYSPKAAFGMAEFNTLTPGVQSYYDKKFHGQDTNIFDDFIVPGVKDIFTQEGLESAFLGGLVGGAFEHSEKKQQKEYDAQTRGKATEIATEIANELNKAYAESYLKSQVDHYNRASAISEQQSGLSPDDVLNRKDASFDYLHNYITERVKHGLNSMVKSDISQYKELASSPEGLQQLKDDGIIHKDITKEDFIKHLDNMQVVADRTAVKYEQLNATYGNMVDKDGSRLYPDEVLEKMLYSSEKINDYTGRIEALTKKSLDAKMPITQFVTALEAGDKERVKLEANRINDYVERQLLTDDQKANLKRDAGDIARMYNRKRTFIKEYNDIHTSPFEHKDSVIENVVKPSATNTATGQTIKLTHANSKADADGNVVPSDVEVGQEYFAGGIESPGQYEKNAPAVKEFAKFKILADGYKNSDGSITPAPALDVNGKPLSSSKRVIKISYDNGQKETWKDASAFKNLKLSKVSDVEANGKAMFYINHANDVFTYRFGRDGEAKKGVINYDKASDSLMFKYRGNDGKIYNREVDIEDFTQPRNGETEPRLRFMDSKVKISPEEYQMLKDYRDPNKAAKAQRQLEIVDKVLKGHKEELSNLKDKIQEHEDFLKDVKSNITKLQERIDKDGVTKKSLARYSKELTDMQDFHDTLNNELGTMQERKGELQDYVDSIEDSISNLSATPDGTELIKFLKNGSDAIREQIKNNDTIIGQIQGLIGKARNYIESLTSSLVQKIARFESKYPSEFPDGVQDMSQLTAKNLLAILKTNEFDFNKKEGLTYDDSALWQKSQVGTDTPSMLSEKSHALKDFLNQNKDFFKERDDISDNINNLDVRKGEIDAQLKSIEEIQADSSKLQKELDVQNSIINAFEDEYRKWQYDVKYKQDYDKSPERKKVFKSVNTQLTEDSFNVSPENVDTKEVQNKLERFSQKLSLANRPFSKSIIVKKSDKDDKNPDSFFNRNNKWAEREESFKNDYAKNSFTPISGSSGVKDKLNADNVKVITIHRNNQDSYGFSNFIPDTYYNKVLSKDIPNNGSNRDNARAAIALVYVYDHEGTLYTMDKSGKLLNEVNKNTKQNPDEFVHTYLDNTVLTREGNHKPGEDKFFDTEKFTPEEINEVLNKATKERAGILDSTTIYPEKFQLNGNKLNVTTDSKTGETQVRNNSVVNVGILEQKDLYIQGTLNVATQESSDNPGYSNIAGIPIPLGVPYVNTKSGPITLGNRRLYLEDGKNIYNIIKKLVNDSFNTYTNGTSSNPEEGANGRLFSESSKKVRTALVNYLRSITYFKNPGEDRKITKKQVYINKTGELILGGQIYNLTPELIEREDIKKSIIENIGSGDSKNPKLFHNIDNKNLKEPGAYTQRVVDDSGNEKLIYWKNYQTYLLSPKYDLDENSYSDKDEYNSLNNKSRKEGLETDIPLTVNAIKPVNEGEYVVVNRYITVNSIGERMTPKPKVLEAPKVEEPKPTETGTGSTYLQDKTKEIAEKAKTMQEEQPKVSPKYGVKIGAIQHEIPLDGEVHSYDTGLPAKDGKGSWILNFKAEDVDGKVTVTYEDELEQSIAENTDRKELQSYDILRKAIESKIQERASTPKEEAKPQATPESTPIEKTKEELRKEIVDGGRMYTEMSSEEQRILDSVEESKPAEPQGLPEKQADSRLEALLKRRGTEGKGRPNFRIIQEEEQGMLSPKDHKDFMDFMKTKLPGVDVKILEDVIRLSGNSKAWGKSQGNVVSIFKDAPTIAKYHEAFHATFDTFLTNKEKQDLYNEFRNREGNYKDLASGELRNFKDASNYEIEDRLAEEFGAYKTGKKLEDTTEKKMNFFQRLWEAVKALFKNTARAKDIFNKIDSGRFAGIEAVTIGDSDIKYSVNRGLRSKFSPEVINDNVKGIAYLILKDARIEDGGIGKIVQGKKTFNDLINPVKNYYTRYFLGESLDPLDTTPVDYTVADNPEYSNEKVESLFNNWNNVLNNWEDYAQEVRNYLKSKKIVFEPDRTKEKQKFDAEQKDLTPDDEQHPELSSDNVEQITEQASNYNNRDYGVDITKLDAKDNSPVEIKILFDSLPATKFDSTDKKISRLNSYNPDLVEPPTTLSSNGMPTLIGDNSMFYKVMGSLNGADGLPEMERRFKKLAMKTPELVRPYRALFETAPKDRTADQWRMAMLFEKTFSKQKPDYIIHRIDENGNSYSFNANEETDVKSITNDFFNSAISRYGKSDLIKLDEYGNYEFNKDYTFKNDPIKAPVDFLKEVGYNFPQEVFDKLTSAQQKQLGQEAERLKSQLKNIKTKGGRLVSEDSVDTDAVRKIAELYVAGDGVFKSSQHLSINNEPIQNYILPNNFSVRMSKISQISNLSELKNKFPEYNDVFSRNSLLLSKKGYIFNESGEVGYQITPTITEGLVASDDRTANSEMNLGVRFMQAFNMNVGARGEGNFYNLIPADSKSEWGAQIKHYIPVGDYSSTRYKTIVRDIFKDYLADEIDLIKDFNNNPNRSKFEQLAKTVEDGSGLKIGQRLRFFKDILDKDLVKDIHDHANSDSEVGTEEYIKSIQDRFNTSLDTFLDKQIKDTQDFLEDSRILDISDNGYIFRGLSSSFISEMANHNTGFDRQDGSGRHNFSDPEVKDMIGFRNINLLIHNIELHKMWVGDPAMYKDETKRIKLFLSGKEFTHVDGENQQGMNYALNRDTNKVGEHDLQPGQLGYHSNSDTFDIVTYDHNDQPSTSYVSPSINQYREVLGEARGDKYTEINGIDAQSHMGLPWYREHKMKTGVWTDQQEQQYQYDMALMRKELTERFNNGETKFGKYAYKEGNKADEALKAASEEILAKGNPEIISAFYIDKPLGSGIYANSDTLTPFALKTSTFALTWEAVRGRHMEDMYLNMLENNVAYMGPKSQHKVGTLAETPVLYDKATGRIGLDAEQMNASKQTISWQDFGKIVETNSSHDKVTLASQLTKQDTLGLFDTGMPKDFFDAEASKKDGAYFGQKMAEWDGMTEAEKEAKSDYYKWFNIKNKCLEALGDMGKDNVFETLGISMQDGTPQLQDVEKLIDFLSNEVTRRDLPENLKEALGFQFNAETKQMELANPIEALSNFNQLRSIINSTIDKNISRSKVSGAQMILVSSTGFDSLETPLKKMVKGKDGWSEISNEAYAKLSDKDKKGVRLMSENLKSYTRVNEGGKEVVTRMQVYAPNIFIEKMKKANVKLSDEELFDYLNTDEGKKLLQGIGFRIPTQGQNSIDSFEIVPFDAKNKKFFMPSSYGHAIVVPAELATKVGSDFDVDKLNCYFKNHYIDKKGYPRLVEFVEDTTNRDSLLQLYVREYGDRLKKFNKFNTHEVDTLSEKLVKEIFGQEAEGTIPSFDDFVRDNTSGDAFKLNGREAIENKYYDNLHDIICNPKSFEQLIAPNDASELQGYEGYVNNIKQRDLSAEQRKTLETTKAAKNDINYSNLTNPISLNQERQNFMDAKDQVGVAASNNSSHAITMTSFIRLHNDVELSQADRTLIGNNDLTVKLPHNQVRYGKGAVSVLSGGQVDGKYIADKLSQVIDGTVDAAKDPWLMRLFPSKEALSTALFLTRLGTPMDNIVLFLHQPSILRYIKEQNGNRTVRNLDPSIMPVKKTDILEQVKQKFPSAAYAPREVGRPFTVKELSDLMAKANSNKSLSGQENATQKQILDEYVKYTVFAEHLFKVQQGAGWDTMTQPSVSSSYLKEQQLSQARENNIIDSPDKIMKDNFISNRRKNILETTKAFSTIFKSATDVFQAHILPIWDAYTNGAIRTSSDTKRQIMDKAQTSFINFLTENFYKVGGNPLSSGIRPLVFGDTFIKKLTEAQAANKEGHSTYNMALDKLRVQYSIYSKDIKNITLADRPKDKYSADAITESFRALKVSHPDLYRNLVILGHLQYGLTDSRLSLNKFIPVEDYLQAIKSGLSHLKPNSPDIMTFLETNQFYKNNWGNEDICPTAKQSWSDEYQQYYVPGRIWEPKLKQNMIVLPSDSRNGAYPVIKVKSSVNPETGADYTLQERNELTQKGFGFKKSVELYRRIEDSDGNPIQVGDKFVYKQINALGDGNNLQEHYTDNRPSERPLNFKVSEYSDEDVLATFPEDSIVNKNLENPDKSNTFVDKDKLVQSLIENKEIKTKDC